MGFDAKSAAMCTVATTAYEQSQTRATIAAQEQLQACGITWLGLDQTMLDPGTGLICLNCSEADISYSQAFNAFMVERAWCQPVD
jgi:hypothetical protein